MDIRKLLQEWETHYRPDAAVVNMQVKLPLKHVARVRALAEMYTGRSEEQIHNLSPQQRAKNIEQDF